MGPCPSADPGGTGTAAIWARVRVNHSSPPIILGRAFPWILPSVGGLAIWATTPAFIYALRAPWDRWTLACWAGILLFVCILFQFGGTGGCTGLATRAARP